MNTNLKRLTGIALAAFAVAFSVNAQEIRPVREASVKKYSLEMFGASLQEKECPGIVEGTLYNIIECKNRFPEIDYSDLVSPISNLAKEHNDIVMGYKASLTGLYLAHSSDIHITPIRGAEDHEYLFKQIADQLEQKLVTAQSEPVILSEIK
jgi:hypothetical protein